MSGLRDNYDRPMLLEIPSKEQVISIYSGTGDNLLEDDIEKGYTGYIVYDVYSFEEYDRIRDGREPRDIDTEDEFSDGDIVSQGFFYIKEDIQEMTNQEVINSILSDAYEYDLTLPAYTLLDADHEGVEGFGQRIDEPAFSEKSDVIIEAMGAAGYTYDSINSGDELIFRDEYGAARFDNWHEAYGWLNTVTFDNPDISDKVEKILKGTYKKDILLNVQERAETEKSAEGILKLFDEVYDYMYQNGDRTPKENILDYHEALRIGDELIKNEPNLISELVNLREDAFTSDREVAALGYAYTQNKEYVHEKVNGPGSLKDFHDYKGERAMRYDLSYEQFKEEIVNNIKNFLPEEYAGADIELNKVKKPGGVELDGLTIKKPGSIVAPNIYLNDMYRFDYKDGRSMDEIMQSIVDLRSGYELFGAPKDVLHTDDLTVYDNIKDKLVARVVDPKTCKDYLADKPHTMFNDMAVMYAVSVGNIPAVNGTNGQGSMPVTDELLEKYGVSVDELHKAAVANMEKEGISVRLLADILAGAIGTDRDVTELPDELKMLIVTNKNAMHGSAMMLVPDEMKKISERIDGDFVIFPSSVHEFIALPVTISDENLLNQMIYDINISLVDIQDRQDRLPAHIYVYDSEKGEVVMPEIYFKHKAFDPEHVTGKEWDEFTEQARNHSLGLSNAIVYEYGDTKVLSSYGQAVATITESGIDILIDEKVSNSVAAHISEFLRQEADMIIAPESVQDYIQATHDEQLAEKFREAIEKAGLDVDDYLTDTTMDEMRDILRCAGGNINKIDFDEHVQNIKDSVEGVVSPSHTETQTKQTTDYAKQQLFDNDKGINRA